MAATMIARTATLASISPTADSLAMEMEIASISVRPDAAETT